MIPVSSMLIPFADISQMLWVTNPRSRARLGCLVLCAILIVSVVADASAAQTQNSETNEVAFLRLTVPKRKVYLGEMFAVDLQLFVMNPHDLNMPQIRAEGFTIGALTQPTRSRKTIGEKVFEVFSFKTAVTPAKTGMLSLGPAECALVLRLRKQSDPDDPVRSVFGSGVELQPAAILSPIEPIEVFELPKMNQPEIFTGAVGNYSLSVSASPTDVNVGDPITVKIQIAGEGALNALTLPSPRQWREFATYPPTSSLKTSDALGLRGIKTFEQIVVPENSEIGELPSVSFAFFSPEKDDYVTLSKPPIPVSIQPRPMTSSPLPVSDLPASTPPNRDLAHIKPFIGTLGDVPRPLLFQPWFVLIQGIPLIALLSLSIWKKRKTHSENNSQYGVARKLDHLSNHQLEKLKRLCGTGQEQAFFETLFRLLQEILGERLNMPAAAITEAVIDERLRSPNTPEELISGLHSLFQLCNQSRYSPRTSPQELRLLIPRIEAVNEALACFTHKFRETDAHS